MKARLWRFLAILALFGGSLLDRTPARALGIPQIEIVEPQSPALAGVCIVVRVKIDWDNSYGSMHVRFGDEGWQESSETQFERVFCTGKYEPGTYKIRAEARNKSDNSWSNPTVAEVDFTLLSLSEMIPPGTVAYYGTLHQTYDAKIGNDLYHFQGGAVLDYNSQRWLVPNDQTAAALCISAEHLNPWNESDADLSSRPRGPDIPDIITQPEAFWKIRNEYFPFCNWTPGGSGTIEQPDQQAQQPVIGTPTGQATGLEPDSTEVPLPPDGFSGEQDFWCFVPGFCVKAAVNVSCSPQCVMTARSYRKDLALWGGGGTSDKILAAASSQPSFMFEGKIQQVRVRSQNELPQAGDLVVWPSNCDKAWSGGGHIGYVTSGNPFKISDSNWGNPVSDLECATRIDAAIPIKDCMEFITMPYQVSSSQPTIEKPVDKCSQYSWPKSWFCKLGWIK